MPGKHLHHALAQANKAMQSICTAEIQQLPLLDCAFMLNTLPRAHELTALRQQLARRLQEQLNVSWINKGDAYEVFSVLTALWKYQPTNITGEYLASATQRLVRSEVVAGGPYYSKDHIDITVNAQIAIFIRSIAKPLPKLDAFLTGFVAEQRAQDTELTRPDLLYLLGEACSTPDLTQYVANHWHQKKWQTPWCRAVAVAILLGGSTPVAEVEQTLILLCADQHKNGFWEGDPLPKVPFDQTASRLTTTALVVGVLSDYEHAETPTTVLGLQHRHYTIAHAAKQIFNTYDEPLRTLALATITQMCNADKNFEITLLPHFFAQALQTSQQLTDQQRTLLGLASLCVWMAYTIYDDFLDDEGEPAKLPVANIAMRASLDCFRAALPDRHDFQEYVAHTFSAMDEANAWEVGHCRFIVSAGKVIISELPKYGNCSLFAARSFAHALAPIAALLQLLPNSSKGHIRYVESAFRHYLIARQLNDDIHDWLKDMRAGQANYAVTAILRDMRVLPGTYSASALLPAMQKCFRKKTMLKVCQRILRHTARSKKAFAQSELMQTPNDVYLLLDNLELSVRASLDKQLKAEAFYASMREFERN